MIPAPAATAIMSEVSNHLLYIWQFLTPQIIHPMHHLITITTMITRLAESEVNCSSCSAMTGSPSPLFTLRRFGGMIMIAIMLSFTASAPNHPLETAFAEMEMFKGYTGGLLLLPGGAFWSPVGHPSLQ